MKLKLLVGLVALAVWLACADGFAAETNAVAVDLRNLVSQIQAKLDKGQRTEADLAEDIKEFDALLAKHKADKPDDLARVLIMKAKLYLEVLDEPEKALDVVQQMKRDFPETATGKKADDYIDNIKEAIEQRKRVEEAKKIQLTQQPGTKFPDFEEKDIAGQPLSIANYKGKVVLVDFWATWCGPCMQELPNVLQTYEKYHSKGLEIIGVNLDEDKARVMSFVKQRNMPWQQFCDGKKWESKLVTKYGVIGIPATFLLDREGKIIAKDVRGPELQEAVSKALAKE